MKKNPPENKPTQWEIGQPSDVFSKNPVKIKIPLRLLQRGVLMIQCLFSASGRDEETSRFLSLFRCMSGVHQP